MNEEHSVKTWQLVVLLVLLLAAGWFGHRGWVESRNALDARNLYETAQHLAVAGKPEEAAVLLEQCIRAEPEFYGAYPDLAAAYFALYHDRAAAMTVIRRGLMVMPENGDLHGDLGRLLFLHGDTAAAVAELEKGKSLGAAGLDELLANARKADAPKKGD